jgi:TetR/AcrR family transcriptional regulator, transcriptional repressor for nem operon
MNEKEKQKAESRERILDAAAKLFRLKGFTATGVDELMAEAGLTAGAFYAHFKSKQDLFDQALKHSFQKARDRLIQGVDLEAGRRSIDEVLARYVSELHRDHPEHGCAIPAIAAEIGRHSKRGKETIGEYLERWAKMFEKNGVSREQALRLVSQAIGAVMISRIVPEELSSEILKASAKSE